MTRLMTPRTGEAARAVSGVRAHAIACGPLLSAATSPLLGDGARGAVAIDVPRTKGRRVLHPAPACTGPVQSPGPCTRTGAERARSVAVQGAEAAGLFAPCRGDIGGLR